MLNVKVGDYVRVEDGEFWMEGTVEKITTVGREPVAYMFATLSSSEFVLNTSGNIILDGDKITHLQLILENE